MKIIISKNNGPYFHFFSKLINRFIFIFLCWKHFLLTAFYFPDFCLLPLFIHYILINHSSHTFSNLDIHHSLYFTPIFTSRTLSRVKALLVRTFAKLWVFVLKYQVTENLPTLWLPLWTAKNQLWTDFFYMIYSSPDIYTWYL